MALQGVDVHVPRGAILGVIGMNGSGKTTMLNCINGIYTPDEAASSWMAAISPAARSMKSRGWAWGAPSRCRASSAS